MAETPERTAAIRRGDREVLGQVVRDALPSLLRAARAAGLAQDAAEDAVQDAVLVLVRRAPEFDGRARVNTWLHGILAHKIREARRAVARHQDHDEIDAMIEARFRPDGRWAKPPRRPDDALTQRELRHQIAHCMDTVSAVQRQAFMLREVEGFTTSEVCKILDVSANNLGVLLFRARNRLRECLEHHVNRSDDDAVV
ncbi:MAG: sigma-70 family RNA polymerase sigma factor [Gemmatimonadota bacterium]